ncbi:hypothetical protein GO003_009810 [Methylicorpusculum oleiharenae]|uniref:hypothetical protein n=1 Tax=Methylicorpusculum oleiharenae TaxID=1338687 RepID=UPI00135A39BC|nr:hypothetical protein [Methylicorpusculum oleiharenae]MCD2450686.1 hypothetical protein [Methylicorpusculum oleiharenae]
MTSHLLRTPIGTVLLVLALLPFPGHAREWYAQPSSSLRTFYDDNLLLRQSDDKFEAFGATLSAKSKFGVRSEIYDIAGDARVDINRYEARDNIDSENFFFNGFSTYNLTDRNQFGLKGNYTMDNSIISEFDASGLVQALVDRTSWSIDPSWTYRLTERASLTGSYNHTDVSFAENTSNNFLTSYATDSATLNYSLQWTERLLWYSAVSALRFDVPETTTSVTGTVQLPISGGSIIVPGISDTTSGSVSDMYTFQTGVRFNITETWDSELMAGGRWTEVESTQFQVFRPSPGIPIQPITFGSTSPESSSGLGYLLTASTTKRFEKSSIGARFYQDVRPTANGVLQEYMGLTLDGEHRLNEHLRLNLTASATQQTSAANEDQPSRFDRDAYMVEPKLSWLIDRHMTLTGGYRYRSQEFTANNSGMQESNSVYFLFNYQWDKFAISR